MSQSQAYNGRAFFSALNAMEGYSLSDRVRIAMEELDRQRVTPNEKREAIAKLLSKAA